MNDIRENFPFFRNNPNTIYFDNASTSQKPQVVLDTMQNYFETYCANAGRGSYAIANRVTKEVETVREKVKHFINAHSLSEIVFTSGATASLNTVAYSWGLHNLVDGDEILVCFDDHDSNTLPWLHLKDILRKKGINIKVIPFKSTSAGDANIQDILSKVSKKTRLIALTHVHNVYGVKTDVEILRKKIDDEILLSLDASQSIGHIPVDVQALGIDFLSFSGHKMFASTGIGVLWINERVHNNIYPFMVGGGVVTSEGKKEIVYKSLPYMLEGGTENLAGILSLGAAIDFIESVSIEKIQARIFSLSQYLLAKLRTIEQIEFLPGIAYCRCAVGYGIISFNISGISSQEAGFILNEHGICVRTGSHCTGGGDAKNDSIRVSLHIYNTEEEIDRFVECIKVITLK
jgi:cysteine desulfurase / selenocysteine lyase